MKIFTNDNYLVKSTDNCDSCHLKKSIILQISAHYLKQSQNYCINIP